MLNIVSDNIPQDISKLETCKLWIASDRISQPNLSNVNFCPDYSSFNNDLTNFTSKPPRIHSKEGNLLSGIFFDYENDSSTTQYLNSSQTVIYRPSTFCALVKLTRLNGSFNTILGSAFGEYEISILNNGDASNSVLVACQSSFGLLQSDSSFASKILTNQPFILTVTYASNSDVTIYINNTLIGSGNNGTLNTNSGKIKIGGGGGQLPLTGSVSEAMFF